MDILKGKEIMADAPEELKRRGELADARKELEKVMGVNPVSQKCFGQFEK